MNKDIVNQIQEHKKQPNLRFRLKTQTEAFTKLLFYTLFDTETAVATNLEKLGVLFDELVTLACWDTDKPCTKVWENYLAKLPFILEKLNKDALAIHNCDPAARSVEEVYMAYPGFYAIAIYRLAHELHIINFPMIPRLMTEYAHRNTGVDIHPGALIGESFFIDHATGVVIGESSIIKNNVKIYQGVTLGALYIHKELAKIKRHPTIEDNVTIYANATILGGETIVGANSIIGGNAWITNSVPKNSKVYHTPEITIKPQTHVS